ncbi:MAG: hypothetical protein ACRD11_11020 [Terriglobia bacterium]
MKKVLMIVLAAIILASVSRPANAQLFGGIVYDPTNFHSAVLRYYQLRMQLTQMQATYSEIVNSYNLAVVMTRNIRNMPQRYLASWSPWRYASARDVYGNATPWINGANSGALSAVLNGYQRATIALETYNPASLAAMPQAIQRELQSRYATVELRDGANENALATMGAIRANAIAATNAVSNIQNDSLSNSPGLNTQVAVLNKVNATGVLGLQTSQDTNKLLVAILEQQTIRAKQLRDAQAQAINQDIYGRANAAALNQQLTGGIESALANFRIP